MITLVGEDGLGQGGGRGSHGGRGAAGSDTGGSGELAILANLGECSSQPRKKREGSGRKELEKPAMRRRNSEVLTNIGDAKSVSSSPHNPVQQVLSPPSRR